MVPLVVSVLLAVLLMALLCLLRTCLPRMYMPRTLLVRERPPPPLPPGAVAWLWAVWTISDDTVFRTAGLDAFVYLKFQEVIYQ